MPSKMFVDLSDTFALEFQLEDNAITHRWADKVQLAQKLGYPIDDPERFYGFDSPEEEAAKALALINNAVDEIRCIPSLRTVLC